MEFITEYLALWMFVVLTVLILRGYPVAFGLLGTSLVFGLLGILFQDTTGFRYQELLAIPLRAWGTMTNVVLMAIPLFIFMGMALERSGLAEDLLETMGLLFGKLKGGLAISVVVVGVLLGASTGIVGATVVTMGLIALPAMLNHGYKPELATGTIMSSGTLGQIIPPSLVLVVVADIIQIPVGDLFMAAVIPGLLLSGLYIIYIIIYSNKVEGVAPAVSRSKLGVNSNKEVFQRAVKTLFPLLALIFMVLGSIFAGIASPTEAASVGAFGAIVLSIFNRKFSLKMLKEVALETTNLTCMVFTIIIGARAFGLVFRALSGDEILMDFASQVVEAHSRWVFLAIVMIIIFVLGFFLEFIEISFIFLPVLAPMLIAFEFDPLWIALLVGLNLQCSFMTPPFGFSIFFLKGVAPPEIDTLQLYRGVVPFVILQIIGIALTVLFPAMATWLPKVVFGP
ncbi:MAG: TRAP transporter large permease subunit [Desulfarculaceae bacterium]|nr:TRAP transporter large permease subunit [Desulfarculaceae bacterium]MCF8071113.1 TRAP transporter large permease subunit [Desulfarculaceae bacterium]MCF8101284.1 TRAP transporter large permease subunit [Desulfarculaceae bacterium]MCF8115167.1 TRAP transporter large permease subunit [Desulfarculaceae bacterium]